MPNKKLAAEMEFLTLVNGIPETHIAVADRGFLYGDGFFTTLNVRRGDPTLWHLHLQRLQQCAQTLFGWESLPEPFVANLLSEIKQVAANHPRCGVRITFSRGVGGRGYAPPQQPQVTRIVSAFAWPEHYKQWQQTGIRTELAQFHLVNAHPALVGLKTLNRIEQVMIKQELALYQTDDVIVLDAHGYIAEASAGNIFWRKGKVWYTPALEHAGIHGVVRSALLNKYAKVRLVSAPVAELKSADEAFVCNALMGQVSLRNVGSYKFPVVRDYSATRSLRLMD